MPDTPRTKTQKKNAKKRAKKALKSPRSAAMADKAENTSEDKAKAAAKAQAAKAQAEVEAKAAVARVSEAAAKAKLAAAVKVVGEETAAVAIKVAVENTKVKAAKESAVENAKQALDNIPDSPRKELIKQQLLKIEKRVVADNNAPATDNVMADLEAEIQRENKELTLLQEKLLGARKDKVEKMRLKKIIAEKDAAIGELVKTFKAKKTESSWL